MILQFLSALQIHSLQLIPNSLKFIVAAITLNEVEGKGITVNDLLFTFNVKKHPQTGYSQATSYILPFCLQEILHVFWETHI